MSDTVPCPICGYTMGHGEYRSARQELRLWRWVLMTAAPARLVWTCHGCWSQRDLKIGEVKLVKVQR